MALEIRQFPCLEDNYGFLIRDGASGRTAAIDTPDAARILKEADAAGWTLTDIWNTHHHWDHAGGNLALKSKTGARISAPAAEAHRIEGVDRALKPGETIALGALEAQVLDVGGHTLGHIAYYFASENAAFVGDSLFALGCGRLFEGTPEQAQAGLARLRALPPETVIYCAHEYTAANARFALSVDPDNAALQAYSERVTRLRAHDWPTVPTTIAAERAANPFLRWDDEALRRRLNLQSLADAEIYGELRRRKDEF